MLLEQALDGEEALDYALGVIHPVDAHTQEHVVGSCSTRSTLARHKRDRQLVVRPLRRPLDGNRIRLDSRQIAAIGDGG